MPRRVPNACTTSSTSSASSPPASRCDGGAGHRGGQLEQQRAQQVGDHDRRPARAGRPIGPGQRLRAQIEVPHLDLTPFTAAFSRAASTLSRSLSRPSTGAKPSRAAAIASTPEPVPTSSSARAVGSRRGQLEQKLEAQACTGMTASAECLSRVDHDLLHPCIALGARRPPTAVGRDRAAAAARPPGDRRAPRPARGDESAANAPASRLRCGSSRSPPAHRPRPRSGRGGSAALPARRKPRTRPSRLPPAPLPRRPAPAPASSARTSSASSRRTRTARRITPVWLPSARRSLANIDSSERRFSGVSVSVQPLEQLALLVAQPARDHDVDDHPQVAVAPAAE